MSEKYIDLAGDIASTYRIDRGVTDYVLHALDRFIADHPEQVPGRTITESEFRDAYSAFGDMDGPDCYGSLLDLLGITVTPDPKPTNAERLNSLYGEWANDPSPTKLALGEWLELRGVKAQGGDDE